MPALLLSVFPGIEKSPPGFLAIEVGPIYFSLRCQPKLRFIRLDKADGEKVGDYKSVLDEQSFYEELYRAHRTRIVQLCRLWLNDPHEAEEVAQEVFLKLLQVSKTQDSPIAWKAWLTRVALNACRDRRRSSWWKWWKEKPMEFEEARVPSRNPTPEEETVSREEREQIWRLFCGLSTRQQEVFALRYVEEWSVEEVARVLELTPGSVKRHLFRAVRHLRKSLGGRR
jgi:RNA polymerase sigma-70 factor, ECF subfamily